MTLLINGIIHVTGEPDVGKTTFALECGADPSRICFFDSDVKGRATVGDLLETGVGFTYHDLVALGKGLRQVEFHEACLDLIADIKPNQYDAIIWDTWTRFGKTCHPYVMAHLQDFRLRWAPMGTIKGAQQWQEARRYEAEILNRLQTLAPTVIVVTHLKDFYVAGRRSGKQVPACSKALVRVPRFRIWLRHNPVSPVPIGLVLKRLDRKIVTDDGLRTVSILPRKITPREGDRSLWDTIGWYFENPIGLRQPTPEETPDAFELSILDGTLTEEQKVTLQLMLKAGVGEEQPELPDPVQLKVMRDNGMTYRDIADETGLTVPEIVAALQEMK